MIADTLSAKIAGPGMRPGVPDILSAIYGQAQALKITLLCTVQNAANGLNKGFPCKVAPFWVPHF